MRFTTRLAVATVSLAVTVAVFQALSRSGSPDTRAESGMWAHFPGPSHGYVEVADDDALDPPSEITIEAWVYLRSYTSVNASAEPSIVGKNYTSSYWLGIALGGQVRFYTHGSASSIDGNAPVPRNEWVHLAVTYDGTTQKHYINGALDLESASRPGPLVPNNSPLRIGSDTAWEHAPNGFIDEVRIWNVVRSGAEIAASMNSTITTPEGGLVGAWNFDGDFDAAFGSFSSTANGAIELVSDMPTQAPTPAPTETPAATATVAPSETPVPTPSDLNHGDIDCDGDVDTVDALLILRHVAALSVNLPEGCPVIGTGESRLR